MGKKEGIDVSYHQGNINFKAVKNSGIDFVILREGYRRTLDTRFFEYVRECVMNKIPIFGVYHFSYALNVEEAKEEAKFCIKNVEKAGLGKDTFIFYDFEYDTVKKAKAAGVTLGPKECRKHTIAFCEEVKAKGYKVGVYTNLDYYRHWYDSTTLAPYEIWLADYTGGPDYNCLLQQYSSSGKVNGILGNVDMNYLYSENEKVKKPASTKKRYRAEVTGIAESWLGRKESDGSHKLIIDIYNTIRPLPRSHEVEYTEPWCAATWSAIAQKAGYTDIMPVECSCGRLIERAKAMGIWVENDAYVPKPGDGIVYDWDDSGKGDDKGWPEHIGTAYEVFEDAGYFTAIEGNYSNAVKIRTISINGRYIRGFITPKYTDDRGSSDPVVTKPTSQPKKKKSITTIAREIISGKYGNGHDKRRKKVESMGYDYDEVRKKVNDILNTPKKRTAKEVMATCKAKKMNASLVGKYKTTANLYCRNDAGTNKKALCKIPEGTVVNNYGYYNVHNGVKWLYIQFKLDGIQYTGFSSKNYLKKL